MSSRSEYCNHLANLNLTQLELAIAFLWFNQDAGIATDMTASEIALQIHEEGFSRPNVTHLRSKLSSHASTIKGKRKNSFMISRAANKSISEKFTPFLGPSIRISQDTILPASWFDATKRAYLISLCNQINGTYEVCYYDSCAVICRRLMETLIIEIYLANGRTSEIEVAKNVFKPLEILIKHISTDSQIQLNRNTPKVLEKIKKLGDTAAHHRTHITILLEIEDIKGDFRRVIQELMTLAKLM